MQLLARGRLHSDVDRARGNLPDRRSARNATVPVEEFCIGPGQNQLQPGEMLVSFHFPPPRPRSGARFLRFIPRNEMDIAVANAAVSLTLNERRDTIEWGRVAIGAVAPTPLLVSEAGEALAGAPATAAGLEKAVQAAQEAARPISDMRGSAAQRRHLVGVLVRRAAEAAIERAKAGEATETQRPSARP